MAEIASLTEVSVNHNESEITSYEIKTNFNGIVGNDGNFLFFILNILLDGSCDVTELLLRK